MCARIRGCVSLAAATVLCGLLGQSLAEAGSWAQADVGAVAVAGSATINSKNGRIKVSGEGVDIGSTADSFHYLYQQLAADGTMVVRAVTLQNTSPWAKGGIMFRQALTPGSIHASLLLTPSNGILFQHRTSAGGSTTMTAVSGVAPSWLRISRRGTTIAAATSIDGVNWTSVSTASIPFTGSIYVGLAVTSSRPSRLAAATFDSMTLSTAAIPPGSDTGLVAAWGFDEGIGAIAHDQLGVHDGAINGGSWTPAGAFGSALMFDGANGTVTVSDHPALDLSTGMTLEAWLYPITTSSWRNVLMKERVGGFSYSLYANTNGAVPAAYVSTDGGDAEAAANVRLPEAVWSHLAVTYDGGTVRLFVNGVQAASRTATGALLQTDGVLRIGGNAAGEFFHGTIDNVRIYNRALAAAEIQADMKTPVGSSTQQSPDNTPPVVAVTAPLDGSVASGTVTVAVAATDDVGVTHVQLSINGSTVGSAQTAPPYAVSWNTTTVPNGTYVITAVARDAAGNTAVSVPVTVMVNNVAQSPNPRAVEFNSPDHNAILSTGQPAVTGYTLEIWQAGANPSTALPYRTSDIGKPSSTTTLISVEEQAVFESLPRGQQYFTTVIAVGPGGSSRSAPSPVFTIQ